MSSPLELPGGSNEPTWGEGGTGQGSMKQHFLKEQLEGASDQDRKKGAPDSQELGDAGKMSQSDAAGGQQSVATSNLSEAQAAEPEMTESVKRACTQRAPSPVPSVISMRSEDSMNQPLNFKAEEKGIGDLTERPVSPMSSVSMCDSDKSNRPNFAQEGTRVFLAAGGVQCDVCHNPAVKACLTCRDSYCQTCIRPHYCDQDLEKHQLQDLPHQDRCEQHNKELEFYCRTDQSAICSRCFLSSHKGHDIIDLDTVRDQTALQTQAKKEGVPPPGPIQVLSVQSNSVTLRWSPPEGASGAYKYRVSWRRGQDSRSIEVVGLEVEMGGLLPGEKYHFSVVTLGEDGQRSTCVESSVQTEVPVPKDLTVTPGSTCVSVAWAKPDGLKDKVSYLCQLSKKEELVKSLLTDELDFNASCLQLDAEYTVHLSTILPNNLQSKPTFKHFRTETPAPQHLTVSSITASSAHLSWEVPPEMKQIPHRFLVFYNSEGAEPKSTSADSCSTDIIGLRPGTEYSVTVCTELQQGGRSKPASVQMKTGLPPPGPIQFPSVQSNSVTLRWSPPEGAPGAYRYRVTWRRDQEQHSTETVEPKVEVEGLLPGEQYHFSVITLGEDGHSSTCVESSAQTEVPVPKNLTATPGPTCVSVTWAKPDGLKGKVSYLFQLFQKEELVMSIVRDALDFNTSDLQHGNEYTVQISTRLPNNCQSKPIAKHFRTETPAPQHLTVSSITASSGHLSWEMPPEMKQTPHSFLVSYQCEGTKPKSISTVSCSTDITGLRPGTEYSVTVCTELQQGGRSKPAWVPMKTGFRLADLLQVLSLTIKEKITFSSVLEISRDMLNDRPAHSLKQLPWAFLRKLMMCNLNARNLSCIDDSNDFSPMNPLDLITAVLLCSDPFLQQEIVSKMSMCQFAIPLLLPNCDAQQSTLMLWAMRDIVKIYRPHSLANNRAHVEGRIVEMDIPMVSFVRLGKSTLPKSQILNKLFSNVHQHYDMFIHHDMECGDVPKKISDGLVEVSWYLPSGTNIDKFTQPVTIANLRGDGRLFTTQMSFLCKTSAAVFIFTDDPENGLNTLANRDGNADLYLVTSSQSETFSMETLCRKHIIQEKNVILKTKQHEAEFMKKLCSCLSDIIKNTSSTIKVVDMADVAHTVGFLTDEDSKDCTDAKYNAREITKKVTDVENFKLDQLPLHGQMWKEISESEKKMCRIRKAGKDIEHHRSELRNQKNELRWRQSKESISESVLNFIAGISTESETERFYFLKWLKIQLDTLSRRHLSKLRDQYISCRNKQGNINCSEITQLDEQISQSSLGPEHFFRELGQLYECACSLPETDLKKATVEHLPGLCAQMLLDGFPFELVDGDASNIPEKWISEVLTQLHEKVGSKSKILVLTVLGVQGTGKSTLLNTMFGVQFAVSSGRCTRGAFMLLIKVSEELRPELKCDFIMVIDTEGLKSPELAAIDTSYEHDNELATLVIGLSDITIVNVAMENNTEMKDILQIVVHAFLRMKEVGKKPRCVFVHQNVSDLSAYINNLRDRKKLVEQLNEMTRAAAKMERREANTKFTDVMEYDPDRDSYYIHGLWYGTPPMAPVNTGYSEAVCQVKKSLIVDVLNDTTERHDAIEFLRWTQDLWDAVKFEDFIFNFRNSLMAEAYTRLCSEYNKWEWSFQKEINSWLQDKEMYISNFGFADCKKHISVLRQEVDQMIFEGSQILKAVEDKLLRNLEEYFSEKDNRVILVEKYKEDFKSSARCLKRETEHFLQNSLNQAFDIREGMGKVNEIKNTQTETIEKGVLKLLKTCRERNIDFSDESLDAQFEEMWNGIMDKLSKHKLEAKDFQKDVLRLLDGNFRTKTGHLKKQLDECDLKTCGLEDFIVKLKWFHKIEHKVRKHIPEKVQKHRSEKEIPEICNSIITDCESFVSEKVQSATDFHCTFITEILSRIDEKAKEFKLSEECEVALKLHICGRAYREFQCMHYTFIKKNNPQTQLELSKSKFQEEFKDLFHKRDQCQKKAKEFMEEILRPAVQDYVTKRLGPDIAEEMMTGDIGVNYRTAKHFQYALLKQMLLEDKYDNYKAYTGSYESFVKNWILTQTLQMLSKDGKIVTLQKRYLSDIVKKITDTVTQLTILADENTDIKAFVQQICTHLKDQLIFSNESKVNSFLILNTAKIEQFSISLREFVKQMEKSMAQSYENQREIIKIDLLPNKPHDMLLKRLIGCGKQCPFCGTPCEAGGKEHKEHIASMHRPEGLRSYRWIKTGKLVTDICSSLVISDKTFQCPETKKKNVAFKKYKKIFPSWRITGDAKVEATDYWKYVLMKFNKEFARDFEAEPADIPQGWTHLTQKQALESLKHSFQISKS